MEGSSRLLAFVIMLSACPYSHAQAESKPAPSVQEANILERYSVAGTDAVLYTVHNSAGYYSLAVTISCKFNFTVMGIGSLAVGDLMPAFYTTSASTQGTLRSMAPARVCKNNNLNEELYLSALQEKLRSMKIAVGPVQMRGALSAKQFAATDFLSYYTLGSIQTRVGSGVHPDADSTHLHSVGKLTVIRHRAMFGATPDGADYEIRDSKGTLIAHYSAECREDAQSSLLYLRPAPRTMQLSPDEYASADDDTGLAISPDEICTKGSVPISSLLLNALRKHLHDLGEFPDKVVTGADIHAQESEE